MDTKTHLQEAFMALNELHEIVIGQLGPYREVYDAYWREFKRLDTALINISEDVDINPFPLPNKTLNET